MAQVPPAPAARRRPRSPRGRARAVARLLAAADPDVRVPLRHRDAFELLAATMLSAQSTDAVVNRVTPALFARYPDPAAMAAADPAEVEPLIRATGLHRTKARALVGMAQAVCKRFGGAVPGRMEDLVMLPGVGRKTASVVLGHWFGVPAIAVDTHVLRVARRLGLTSSSDPVAVEHELAALLPRPQWAATSLRLVLHGRHVCTARAPRCGACVLAPVCPSAHVA